MWCGMWCSVCGMRLQMHTVTGGSVRLYDHCPVSAFHRELFGYENLIEIIGAVSFCTGSGIGVVWKYCTSSSMPVVDE